MRVLVVGSSRGLDEDHEAALRVAVGELGGELARRGHVIVVGSDEPKDVDPHVVVGAFEQDAKGRVEVHVPHGQPEPYRHAELPGQVQVERHQFPNWDVTVMEVIRDRVDAVIAFGGRLGVIQAGLSAWMLDRPVIPVGSFDGGAKTIWEYSSARRTQFYRGGLSDADVDRLAGPWGARGSGPNAAFVVDALERVARATAVSRTPRLLLVLITALLLLALGGWIAILTFPVGPSGTVDLLAVFGCVACAGVLGTMLQTLRAIRDGQSVTGRRVLIDLMLGLLAGVVSAALYMIVQVGLEGSVNLRLEQTDFVRVALIVSMVSLFSASYLDKVFSRFDAISDRVIRGDIEEEETT